VHPQGADEVFQTQQARPEGRKAKKDIIVEFKSRILFFI